MTISAKLEGYLNRKAGRYDTVQHPLSESATESAHLSQLPLKQMAKAVVLHDHTHDHYLMAVIPAMNKVMLPEVQRLTGRRMELASELELVNLFDDCEAGAIPAIGQAFGMPVIWDDAFQEDRDIYVEAGDHRHLVHLTRKQFMSMMNSAPHGSISCAPEELYDLTHY